MAAQATNSCNYERRIKRIETHPSDPISEKNISFFYSRKNSKSYESRERMCAYERKRERKSNRNERSKKRQVRMKKEKEQHCNKRKIKRVNNELPFSSSARGRRILSSVPGSFDISKLFEASLYVLFSAFTLRHHILSANIFLSTFLPFFLRVLGCAQNLIHIDIFRYIYLYATLA